MRGKEKKQLINQIYSWSPQGDPALVSIWHRMIAWTKHMGENALKEWNGFTSPEAGNSETFGMEEKLK